VSGALQWGPGGVRLTDAPRWIEPGPAIVSDGAGGALVVWRQFSPATQRDIVAQAIDASGAPKWASVTTVCDAIDEQEELCVESDGLGGAIIAWRDWRSGSREVYAQRVSASGVTMWTEDGILVAPSIAHEAAPVITTDGANGAIIAWETDQTPDGVYAQRVGLLGGPLWTPGGINVCYVLSGQESPAIASDGHGGAIITWEYPTWSPDLLDLYVQRLDASGNRLWHNAGVPLGKGIDFQHDAQIVPDGTGGAIFAWWDERNDHGDIYAQRLDASGTPQWAINGIGICTDPAQQWKPSMVGDGFGGAILTWLDYRSHGLGSGYYTQRLDSAGTAYWAAGGIALINAPQIHAVRLVSGVPGSGIVTWTDFRSGEGDIYAARAVDPEPGVAYCFGDPGSGTACRCNNDNDGTVPGSGCANGAHASGAQLTASGEASLANDTLVLATTSAVPIENGLYFQADNDTSPGLLWGDGLRCAGGNLKRLEVRKANGSGDSATIREIAARVGNIQPGDTKHYQLWYRDPLGSPCGWHFNTTNGYAVTWNP